jgi:hypothetical protein
MHQFGRLTKVILNTLSLFVVLFMSATAARAHVTASAGSVNFPSQVVGTASAALSVTLTNTGGSPTTIVSASLSLSVFSVSGLPLPLTLSPGQSVVVTVTFVPLAPQAYSDTLVIARNYGSPTDISLSGTGIPSPPLPLNSSSTALSFGNVVISSTTSQGVTLTNAGNSNITVSNVVISGPGFAANGVSAGLILSAGQAATLTVTFDPSSSGTATGSITVTSNATNSPAVIAVSGAGIVPPSVSLSWTASTSVVIGYNSYSSTVSGGPYAKLNASPVAATSYTDNTVNSGVTYYYVVTAVDSSNVESSYSQEVPATVP